MVWSVASLKCPCVSQKQDVYERFNLLQIKRVGHDFSISAKSLKLHYDGTEPTMEINTVDVIDRWFQWFTPGDRKQMLSLQDPVWASE